MIEITGVDLIKFVKKVYDLSIPQGLGFLQYKEFGLTDGEAQACIRPEIPFPYNRYPKNIVVDMDYVKGRACKMKVFKKEDKLLIYNEWYDHTDKQLKELLLYSIPKNLPFPVLEGEEHVIGCNCIDYIIRIGVK